LGFVALEAGWLVTEWGRQPYTIMNTMLTSAAVTPVPHLAVPFWTFTALYVFLAVMVVVLLGRQIRHSSGGEPGEAAAPGTRAVKGAA
jgi:cytochrome d ubiquinol oxidase subunit I